MQEEATKGDTVLVWYNGEDTDADKLTLALSVPRDVTPEGLAQILASEEPNGIVVAIVPRTLWRVKPADGDSLLRTLANAKHALSAAHRERLQALPGELLEALNRRVWSPWRDELERRKTLDTALSNQDAPPGKPCRPYGTARGPDDE